MGLLARQKLFWLRYAVLKATAASQTLLVWLAAKVVTHGDGIVTGKTLVGASAGGTSSSFVAAGSTRSPDSMAEFWDEALELYSVCSAALVASGVSSPSQAAIVTEMQFRLQPVESAVARFDDEWAGVGTEAPS